jgi:hypothetical protein
MRAPLAHLGQVRRRVRRNRQLAELLVEAIQLDTEPSRRVAVELIDTRLRAAPDHRRAADLRQEHRERVFAGDREPGVDEQLEPVAVMHRLDLVVLLEHVDGRRSNRRPAQNRRSGLRLIRAHRNGGKASGGGGTGVVGREPIEQPVALADLGQARVDAIQLSLETLALSAEPLLMAIEVGALSSGGAAEARGGWRRVGCHRLGTVLLATQDLASAWPVHRLSITPAA